MINKSLKRIQTNCLSCVSVCLSGLMHNLFFSTSGRFSEWWECASAMHSHHGDAEGREKTVSIETVAILNRNYWLLTKKKAHVGSVELFLLLVTK